MKYVMFEKIRALATKLGMKNPEKANVGVVIGFIEKMKASKSFSWIYRYRARNRRCNSVPGAIRNSSDCQHQYLVHHAVKFGNYYSERLQSPLHRAYSNGRCGDPWSPVYARRKPESVIPTHSIVC